MVSSSRKKVISEKKFFILAEKCVFTIQDEEILEKYLRKWEEIVSTS